MRIHRVLSLEYALVIIVCILSVSTSGNPRPNYYDHNANPDLSQWAEQHRDQVHEMANRLRTEYNRAVTQHSDHNVPGDAYGCKTTCIPSTTWVSHTGKTQEEINQIAKQMSIRLVNDLNSGKIGYHQITQPNWFENYAAHELHLLQNQHYENNFNAQIHIPQGTYYHKSEKKEVYEYKQEGGKVQPTYIYKPTVTTYEEKKQETQEHTSSGFPNVYYGNGQTVEKIEKLQEERKDIETIAHVPVYTDSYFRASERKGRKQAKMRPTAAPAIHVSYNNQEENAFAQNVQGVYPTTIPVTVAHNEQHIATVEKQTIPIIYKYGNTEVRTDQAHHHNRTTTYRRPSTGTINSSSTTTRKNVTTTQTDRRQRRPTVYSENKHGIYKHLKIDDGKVPNYKPRIVHKESKVNDFYGISGESISSQQNRSTTHQQISDHQAHNINYRPAYVGHQSRYNRTHGYNVTRPGYVIPGGSSQTSQTSQSSQTSHQTQPVHVVIGGGQNSQTSSESSQTSQSQHSRPGYILVGSNGNSQTVETSENIIENSHASRPGYAVIGGGSSSQSSQSSQSAQQTTRPGYILTGGGSGSNIIQTSYVNHTTHETRPGYIIRPGSTSNQIIQTSETTQQIVRPGYVIVAGGGGSQIVESSHTSQTSQQGGRPGYVVVGGGGGSQIVESSHTSQTSQQGSRPGYIIAGGGGSQTVESSHTSQTSQHGGRPGYVVVAGGGGSQTVESSHTSQTSQQGSRPGYIIAGGGGSQTVESSHTSQTSQQGGRPGYVVVGGGGGSQIVESSHTSQTSQQGSRPGYIITGGGGSQTVESSHTSQTSQHGGRPGYVVVAGGGGSQTVESSHTSQTSQQGSRPGYIIAGGGGSQTVESSHTSQTSQQGGRPGYVVVGGGGGSQIVESSHTSQTSQQGSRPGYIIAGGGGSQTVESSHTSQTSQQGGRPGYVVVGGGGGSQIVESSHTSQTSQQGSRPGYIITGGGGSQTVESSHTSQTSQQGGRPGYVVVGGGGGSQIVESSHTSQTSQQGSRPGYIITGGGGSQTVESSHTSQTSQQGSRPGYIITGGGGSQTVESSHTSQTSQQGSRPGYIITGGGGSQTVESSHTSQTSQQGSRPGYIIAGGGGSQTVETYNSSQSSHHGGRPGYVVVAGGGGSQTVESSHTSQTSQQGSRPGYIITGGGGSQTVETTHNSQTSQQSGRPGVVVVGGGGSQTIEYSHSNQSSEHSGQSGFILVNTAGGSQNVESSHTSETSHETMQPGLIVTGTGSTQVVETTNSSETSQQGYPGYIVVTGGGQSQTIQTSQTSENTQETRPGYIIANGGGQTIQTTHVNQTSQQTGRPGFVVVTGGGTSQTVESTQINQGSQQSRPGYVVVAGGGQTSELSQTNQTSQEVQRPGYIIAGGGSGSSQTSQSSHSETETGSGFILVTGGGQSSQTSQINQTSGQTSQPGYIITGGGGSQTIETSQINQASQENRPGYAVIGGGGSQTSHTSEFNQSSVHGGPGFIVVGGGGSSQNYSQEFISQINQTGGSIHIANGSYVSGLGLHEINTNWTSTSNNKKPLVIISQNRGDQPPHQFEDYYDSEEYVEKEPGIGFYPTGMKPEIGLLVTRRPPTTNQHGQLNIHGSHGTHSSHSQSSHHTQTNHQSHLYPGSAVTTTHKHHTHTIGTLPRGSRPLLEDHHVDKQLVEEGSSHLAHNSQNDIRDNQLRESYGFNKSKHHHEQNEHRHSGIRHGQHQHSQSRQQHSETHQHAHRHHHGDRQTGKTEFYIITRDGRRHNVSRHEHEEMLKRHVNDLIDNFAKAVERDIQSIHPDEDKEAMQLEIVYDNMEHLLFQINELGGNDPVTRQIVKQLSEDEIESYKRKYRVKRSFLNLNFGSQSTKTTTTSQSTGINAGINTEPLSGTVRQLPSFGFEGNLNTGNYPVGGHAYNPYGVTQTHNTQDTQHSYDLTQQTQTEDLSQFATGLTTQNELDLKQEHLKEDFSIYNKPGNTNIYNDKEDSQQTLNEDFTQFTGNNQQSQNLDMQQHVSLSVPPARRLSSPFIQSGTSIPIGNIKVPGTCCWQPGSPNYQKIGSPTQKTNINVGPVGVKPNLRLINPVYEPIDKPSLKPTLVDAIPKPTINKNPSQEFTRPEDIQQPKRCCWKPGGPNYIPIGTTNLDKPNVETIGGPIGHISTLPCQNKTRTPINPTYIPIDIPQQSIGTAQTPNGTLSKPIAVPEYKPGAINETQYIPKQPTIEPTRQPIVDPNQATVTPIYKPSSPVYVVGQLPILDSSYNPKPPGLPHVNHTGYLITPTFGETHLNGTARPNQTNEQNYSKVPINLSNYTSTQPTNQQLVVPSTPVVHPVDKQDISQSSYTDNQIKVDDNIDGQEFKPLYSIQQSFVKLDPSGKEISSIPEDDDQFTVQVVQSPYSGYSVLPTIYDTKNISSQPTLEPTRQPVVESHKPALTPIYKPSGIPEGSIYVPGPQQSVNYPGDNLIKPVVDSTHLDETSRPNQIDGQSYQREPINVSNYTPKQPTNQQLVVPSTPVVHPVHKPQISQPSYTGDQTKVDDNTDGQEFKPLYSIQQSFVKLDPSGNEYSSKPEDDEQFTVQEIQSPYSGYSVLPTIYDTKNISSQPTLEPTRQPVVESYKPVLTPIYKPSGIPQESIYIPGPQQSVNYPGDILTKPVVDSTHLDETARPNQIDGQSYPREPIYISDYSPKQPIDQQLVVPFTPVVHPGHKPQIPQSSITNDQTTVDEYTDKQVSEPIYLPGTPSQVNVGGQSISELNPNIPRYPPKELYYEDYYRPPIISVASSPNLYGQTNPWYQSQANVEGQSISDFNPNIPSYPPRPLYYEDYYRPPIISVASSPNLYGQAIYPGTPAQPAFTNGQSLVKLEEPSGSEYSGGPIYDPYYTPKQPTEPYSGYPVLPQNFPSQPTLEPARQPVVESYKPALAPIYKPSGIPEGSIYVPGPQSVNYPGYILTKPVVDSTHLDDTSRPNQIGGQGYPRQPIYVPYYTPKQPTDQQLFGPSTPVVHPAHQPETWQSSNIDDQTTVDDYTDKQVSEPIYLPGTPSQVNVEGQSISEFNPNIPRYPIRSIYNQENTPIQSTVTPSQNAYGQIYRPGTPTQYSPGQSVVLPYKPVVGPTYPSSQSVVSLKPVDGSPNSPVYPDGTLTGSQGYVNRPTSTDLPQQFISNETPVNKPVIDQQNLIVRQPNTLTKPDGGDLTEAQYHAVPTYNYDSFINQYRGTKYRPSDISYIPVRHVFYPRQIVQSALNTQTHDSLGGQQKQNQTQANNYNVQNPYPQSTNNVANNYTLHKNQYGFVDSRPGNISYVPVRRVFYPHTNVNTDSSSQTQTNRQTGLVTQGCSKQSTDTLSQQNTQNQHTNLGNSYTSLKPLPVDYQTQEQGQYNKQNTQTNNQSIVQPGILLSAPTNNAQEISQQTIEGQKYGSSNKSVTTTSEQNTINIQQYADEKQTNKSHGDHLRGDQTLSDEIEYADEFDVNEVTKPNQSVEGEQNTFLTQAKDDYFQYTDSDAELTQLTQKITKEDFSNFAAPPEPHKPLIVPIY